MQKLDKKREIFVKNRGEKIMEDQMRREAKTKNVHIKLSELEEGEFQKRRDILDYQMELMNRSMKMSKAMDNRKRFHTESTINNQMAIQNNMMKFMKKLNTLKSQSVRKHSIEKRIKIFKELKRQEAERKKREKEDELFNKGLLK